MRSLCWFKLKDPSPVGQTPVAMRDFIVDALAGNEDFESFTADSDELFLCEQVVQMYSDWRFALASSRVSNGAQSAQ